MSIPAFIVPAQTDTPHNNNIVVDNVVVDNIVVDNVVVVDRGAQLGPHHDDHIDWLVATSLSRWNELQPEIDHVVFTLERTLLRVLFNELVSDLTRF